MAVLGKRVVSYQQDGVELLENGEFMLGEFQDGQTSMHPMDPEASILESPEFELIPNDSVFEPQSGDFLSIEGFRYDYEILETPDWSEVNESWHLVLQQV